jgi:hypothetical protein
MTNNYFINIFTSQNPSDAGTKIQEWMHESEPNHAEMEDFFTNSIPDMQEIFNIAKNMKQCCPNTRWTKCLFLQIFVGLDRYGCSKSSYLFLPLWFSSS